MEATAPGRYEAYFEPAGEGIYLVDGGFELDGEEQRLTTGIIVGYPPEYDFQHEYQIPIDKLSLLSDGTIISDPSQVFGLEVPHISSHLDLSRISLWLAFLVFLFEIIIRKTNLLYKSSQYLGNQKLNRKARRDQRQSSRLAAHQVSESSYASDLVNRKKDRRS